MTLETLKDLYIEQLRDVYSAETQLIEALPKMAKAATHSKLQSAYEDHLKETKKQKDRLEKIFDGLGEKPTGETCQAMKGLIKEGEDMIDSKGDDDVRDAGLIAAAQRVEHYEIAAYGTVRTYAEMLGRDDDVKLLKETLEEEKDADEKLNDLAIELINPEALAV